MTWAQETIDCSPENLAPKTRVIVATMTAKINLGTVDDVTTRRFNHALHFILNNGTFPNPVSSMKVGGRVLVLDGNHRAAAQSIWLGKPKNDEAPIT